MRFKDLPLATKQRLGFGLIVLLLAAVNLYSVRTLGTLQQELEQITTNWLPRTIAVSNLNLNAASLRINQLQNSTTVEPEAQLLQIESMIAMLDSIEANRDQYESLREISIAQNQYTDQEATRYAAFDEKWESYLDLSFLYLDYTSEQQTDSAVTLINGPGQAIYQDYSQDLNALVDIKVQDAIQAALRAEGTFKRTRNTTVSLVLSAILLSIMLGTWLVRQITIPVRRLEAAASQVADGDLDVKIDIKQQDEIGNLARSFNQMTASLKTTQNQLIQAEKMASLGQLTSGIAHEIKNPLNFINNFSDLSIELTDELNEALQAAEPEDPAYIQEILNDISFNARKISEHGKRADAIVKGMLAHAGSGSKNRTDVQINELLQEYINLSYHNIRAQHPDVEIQVHRDLAPNLPPVRVQQQELGRALLNILQNAFQAVLDKAAAASAPFQPTLTIATKAHNSGVEISISDNGLGIPDEIQSNIFEPFFTTRPTGEGTGLGLSLSYDIIVQGHNGTLSFESQEGKGSTFRITL